MEKETRNRIQRATQAARQLIEQEYSEQLEGTFDILLDGTISADPGDHLSESQCIVRHKLIEAIAHKRSAGFKAGAAVEAHLREAAFTMLNRLVALKMLEARGIVQECVSHEEESSGFKEFIALAPGFGALEDKGYRLYIESIFDEISREVGILFDRRDVASLLWPRRQALKELLAILNSPELATVWEVDEAIGWVYQYFNGDEERSKMRKESQAPRNSRELAVRNQFFTPRYVVEFLTDNSLGRIWYEMMRGETRLANLDYFVRRPNEASSGIANPISKSEVDGSEHSHEEPLQQTFHVSPRAKKDPRDLRILDPACGSGHFLLYAFDLFVSIYEEAWFDVSPAPFSESGSSLRADYSNLDDLRLATPGLILRHNLHGVDIDPRAAQIAALALWMRAQRAYNGFGVPRAERPPIVKANIVVAEPMPGDARMVSEFAASLRPAVLGDLFEKMVEEMRLAGELGSLLKIEESIAEAVKKADEESRQGNLFAEEFEDQDFWNRADETILASLGRFVESTARGGGIRRQLFAGDTAQGVAFIELMRNRFDGVLMNPPFGAASPRMLKLLRAQYPVAYVDLYAAFVDRALGLASPNGLVGAITSSTLLKLSSFEGVRNQILLRKNGLRLCVELGQGVLDSAMVETAAYTLGTSYQGQDECFFLDASGARERGAFTRESCSTPSAWIAKQHEDFRALPKRIISYNLGELGQDFKSYRPVSDFFEVQRGSATGDDTRFIRTIWEVPQEALGPGGAKRWRWLSKGGAYAGFYAPVHLALDWLYDGGYLGDYMYLKRPRNGYLWGPKSWSRKFIGKPGVTWPLRSQRGLSFRVLPAGCAFSHKSPVLISSSDQQSTATNEYFGLLALLNTDRCERLANAITTFGSYEMGAVGAIPIEWPHPESVRLRDLGASAFSHAGAIYSFLEIDPNYQPLVSSTFSSGASCLEETKTQLANCFSELETLTAEINKLVNPETEEFDPAMNRPHGKLQLVQEVLDGVSSDSVASELFGLSLGRWSLDVIHGGESVVERETRIRKRAFDTLQLRPCLNSSSESNVSQGSGILHDDPGDERDFYLRIEKIGSQLWSSGIGLEPFNRGELATRHYYASNFFDQHIRQYSASRRKAPVYWQLATPSASYSVWCYYHCLTSDTLFRVSNEFIAPKVAHEERKLSSLRQEAGHEPSSAQRNALATQETFVAELRTLLTEVKRIAPMWNPNLNDGVIINFAPLWRLVPQHKAWQKECKKVWDKLVNGEYDWAHLAMYLWPERVVPKCTQDRSLAIAHGLEDELWFEVSDGKWQHREVDDSRIKTLVEERTSPAVKTALDDLLSAPTPVNAKAKRGRKRSSKKTKD